MILTYSVSGRTLVRQVLTDPRARRILQAAGYILLGLCLSAAGIVHAPLPLAMGAILNLGGWPGVLCAAGAAVGYRLFWGSAAVSVLWVALAVPFGLLSGRIRKAHTLLLPAIGGLLTAAAGVLMQTFTDEAAPVGVYLLQVGLGAGSSWLFKKLLQGRNPIFDWLGVGLGMLALAQLMPLPYLGAGYVALGVLICAGSLPAAVIGGLALTVSGVTAVPMAAVAVLGFLPRLFPRCPRAVSAAMPPLACLGVMAACNVWDSCLLPGLAVGGIAGTLLPLPGKFTHRRGETGVAQVRLELAGSVLRQTQRLLLQQQEAPVDEEGLLLRCAESACSGCCYRKNCRDAQRLTALPTTLLHKTILTPQEMPVVCRKPGRYLAQLHRCQEQLRSIHADRQRQREYRAALTQQYRFLSEFLQELADGLPRRSEQTQCVYRAQVTVCANRSREENGDRYLHFSGMGCKYYVLLCDGMGTGPEAVSEGETALTLLKQLLLAGYPASHALQSLNSLCTLRERAGAVTVDLAEISLDTGTVRLYKWGASPSYLVSSHAVHRLGTATPPPGLCVTDREQQVEPVRLQSGQWLVMVSDGICEKEALACCQQLAGRSPGEIASGLLATVTATAPDDATVLITQLHTVFS